MSPKTDTTKSCEKKNAKGGKLFKEKEAKPGEHRQGNRHPTQREHRKKKGSPTKRSWRLSEGREKMSLSGPRTQPEWVPHKKRKHRENIKEKGVTPPGVAVQNIPSKRNKGWCSWKHPTVGNRWGGKAQACASRFVCLREPSPMKSLGGKKIPPGKEKGPPGQGNL